MGAVHAWGWVVASSLWAATAVAVPPAREGTEGRLRAVAFVRTLAEGRVATARDGFAEVMKRALSEAQLSELLQGLVAEHGAYRGVEGVRSSRAGRHESALVRTRFEKGPLDLKVVLDEENRVSGLWVVPSGAAADYAPVGADGSVGEPPPEPQPPAGVREVELTVGADGPWPLPATLTLPASARAGLHFPAVVLVHGSGPNDRDETVGACRPFRDLAWGLASRRVAVLRYDKRTLVHGGRLKSAALRFTVKEEVVDDAVAAAVLLRGRPEIDPARVVVLGHSLGGYLVPRLLAADPKLAGAVALAAAARPLEELVVEQVRYLQPADRKAQRQAEAMAEQVRALDAKSQKAVLGASPAYWLDLRGYDPVAEAKKLAVPMLVLQGGRDYQVTRRDFERWQGLADKKSVTLKLYPRLNHLFVAGEGASLPQEYERGGQVDAAVIDDVARWVSALKAP